MPLIQVANFLFVSVSRLPGQRDTGYYRGCITALIGLPDGEKKFSILHQQAYRPDSRLRNQRPAFASMAVISMNPARDVQALRRQIGMVFQKPTPFPLSIYRNIELPLHEHGVKRRADTVAIIEQVLRDVGLWDEVHDRLHSSALSLSGGQQQRLCIARALALNPRILLMDEPCSALDPIASGIVEDLISRLRGRYTIVTSPTICAVAKDHKLRQFWIKQPAHGDSVMPADFRISARAYAAYLRAREETSWYDTIFSC